ncbi:MAG: LacI family DNA-binding transcriptional regulator [Anaerolineales bacterium]|jgi:LacI family transcriptional regulator
MEKQNSTLMDVATRAGVSRTAVSFVVKGNPGIPEETKTRVMAAISELGYQPNLAAQKLLAQRSGFIGFLDDEIAITPYAGRIFEGAQDAAWKQGKILLPATTKNDPGKQAAALDMMMDRQVEGIIYASMYHRQVTPPDVLWEMRSVLLDCFVADRSLPSVVPDEVGGGFKATSVLLDKGHKRVGFLNNRDNIPATTARLQGYLSALTAHGIPFDLALVASDNSDSDGGYRAARAVMQLPNPPTALFCFNDRMAMGAYYALRDLNLSVPKDVAVMGFDNQEMIAAHLNPLLSTIELPHYEMGQWAINYLLEHIDQDSNLNPVQHAIECPYIERSSI